jgi:hypothetical protein
VLNFFYCDWFYKVRKYYLGRIIRNMIDYTFNGGDNGSGWFLNMMSKELSFIGGGGKWICVSLIEYLQMRNCYSL